MIQEKLEKVKHCDKNCLPQAEERKGVHLGHKKSSPKFSMILCLLLLSFAWCVPAYAETGISAANTGAISNEISNEITIIVNDEIIAADVSPYLKKDRTMVPIRFITEPLGATLLWQGGENGVGGKAILYLDGKQVELTVGSTEGVVNGNVVSMDLPAEVVDGRTFVPLRFAGENLGASVNWNGATKEVRVYYMPLPSVEPAPPSDSQQPPTETVNEKNIIGYYYDSDSLGDLRAEVVPFSDVIHFGYLLTADGSVREKDNFTRDLFSSEGKILAREKGIPTQMLVTAFDRTISDGVLGDEQLRANTVKTIVDFVEAEGFSGVNLDFEVVSVSRGEQFTALVRDLKQALPKGTVLSLSLRCRTYDSQSWLDGYDYGALSTYADQCIVMMYDQHYNGGEPGAIAGADWFEESIAYLLQYIPKEKFVAGIGAYGRYWPENGKGSAIFITPALTLAEEQEVEVKREEGTGVPYFTYQSPEKGKVTVYFEDAVSIKEKIDLVKKYDLSGVAVWRMGKIPDDVWEAINSLRYE